MFKIQRSLWPLLLILILDTMSFGLVIPVLNTVILNPQTSLFQSNLSAHNRDMILGCVLAVFPLAVAIGTPILGFFSDRQGRKTVLSYCLFGGAIGLACCGLSIVLHSISLLLFGRLLTGLTSASQPIAQAATIDLSEEETKPLNLSLVAFAMTIGMVVGPLLGGFLSDPQWSKSFTASTPFTIATVLSLINLVFLRRYFKEHKAANPYDTVSYHTQITASKAVFHSPHVRRLLGAFVAMELSWSLYFQAIPLQLMQYFHYTSEQLSLFISLLGLMMCFGLVVVFRILFTYFNLVYILRLSMTGGMTALIAVMLYRPDWWQWVAIMPFSIAVGIVYTGIISLLSSTVPSENQGWLMGICSSLLALSWMCSGLLTGWFLTASLETTLSTVFLLFLLSGGLIWRIRA